MQRRWSSRYRLSVNVGSGDRYFLFMTTTATEILAALPASVTEGANATDLLRQVLASDPARTVYRLRVPPLWGYIAPTDFLPHDGSTLGSTLFDFSTHVLADFRPTKSYFAQASFFRIGQSQTKTSIRDD